MKGKNSSAVFIFLGALLSFGFGIGVAYMKNPGMLIRRGQFDISWEMFTAFCGKWYWLMGLIGIPMFLISLIISLVRERRANQEG